MEEGLTAREKNQGDDGDVEGARRPEERPLPVERNLATWANFLFPPSHAKVPDVRVRTWVARSLGDGGPRRAKIAVYTVKGVGTLRTSQWRLVLALMKLRQEKAAGADGRTRTSYREIVRALRRSWGTEKREELRRSLRLAKHVPIETEAAFETLVGGKKQIAAEETRLRMFNILADLSIREWYELPKNRGGGRKGRLLDSSIEYRFHEFFEKNLLEGTVKPIFYEVAMQLTGEGELALYSFLDVVLSEKTLFRKELAKLFREDLNLHGNYSRPGEYRRIAERYGENLNGRPISTGVLDVKIEPRADGSYELVARKRPFALRVVEGGRPAAKGRRLTAREQDLFDELIAAFGKESAGAFLNLLRNAPTDHVRGVLSETRYKASTDGVDTTAKRFFFDLAKRTFGDNVFKARRWGSTSGSTDAAAN